MGIFRLIGIMVAGQLAWSVAQFLVSIIRSVLFLLALLLIFVMSVQH